MISFHVFWFGNSKKSLVYTRQLYSSGFIQMWPKPQCWWKFAKAALLPSHLPCRSRDSSANSAPTHLAQSVELQMDDLKLLFRSQIQELLLYCSKSDPAIVKSLFFFFFFYLFIWTVYHHLFTSQSELVFNPLPSTTSVLRVHWGHVSHIFFEIMKPVGKGGVVVSGVYFKTFCNSRPGAIGKDYALQHWWSNHELATPGFHSTEPQMHLKQWLAFLLLFQICSASLLTQNDQGHFCSESTSKKGKEEMWKYHSPNLYPTAYSRGHNLIIISLTPPWPLAK